MPSCKFVSSFLFSFPVCLFNTFPSLLDTPDTSGGFKFDDDDSIFDEDEGDSTDMPAPGRPACDSNSSLDLSDGSFLFEMEGVDYSFLHPQPASPTATVSANAEGDGDHGDPPVQGPQVPHASMFVFFSSVGTGVFL